MFNQKKIILVKKTLQSIWERIKTIRSAGTSIDESNIEAKSSSTSMADLMAELDEKYSSMGFLAVGKSLSGTDYVLIVRTIILK